MTIDENINDAEEAVCIANYSGRILTANKRFCRLFGFEQDEVKWHYLCDLYRRKNELDRILKNISEKKGEVLKTRMRNRAGRSFKCLLTSQATKSHEGIPLMMHSIQRVVA